jgi:hypothetical protein
MTADRAQLRAELAKRFDDELDAIVLCAIAAKVDPIHIASRLLSHALQIAGLRADDCC